LELVLLFMLLVGSQGDEVTVADAAGLQSQNLALENARGLS
jgi:hypothetical protein